MWGDELGIDADGDSIAHELTQAGLDSLIQENGFVGSAKGLVVGFFPDNQNAAAAHCTQSKRVPLTEEIGSDCDVGALEGLQLGWTRWLAVVQRTRWSVSSKMRKKD